MHADPAHSHLTPPCKRACSWSSKPAYCSLRLLPSHHPVQTQFRVRQTLMSVTNGMFTFHHTQLAVIYFCHWCLLGAWRHGWGPAFPHSAGLLQDGTPVGVAGGESLKVAKVKGLGWGVEMPTHAKGTYAHLHVRTHARSHARTHAARTTPTARPYAPPNTLPRRTCSFQRPPPLVSATRGL